MWNYRGATATSSRPQYKDHLEPALSPTVAGSCRRGNRTVNDRIEMWKVDNKSRNWVRSLPAVALAMNSTMYTITQKTPFQVMFCDPIFNVPLLPPGERSIAQVMDEDGSIFAGANEDTRRRDELLPPSSHFSASVDLIEAWLNGVGGSEISVNSDSRRAMSASDMSVTVAASEERQMPTHESKCQG